MSTNGPGTSPHDLPAHVTRRKDATWLALAEELAESRTRRRRRRASAVAMLVVAAAAYMVPGVRPSDHDAPPAERTLVIERTEPARRIEIVDRPAKRVYVESIDDDTLLSELADAGFERSLVRIGSDVHVAFSPKRSTLQPGEGG
ncbi:MAG: hypothetical protein JNM94_16195 [Phycisphaerae bacterium]|nr:hypothetical protein [Phycisphaerae bacterium]